MEASSKALRCSSLRNALASRPLEAVLIDYFGQVRALAPLYERATLVWAERVGLSAEKREQNLAALREAFDRFEDWRFGRARILRKENDAVQRAASFLMNQALVRAVAPLRMAPVVRNAAGNLRMCMHIVTARYGDERVPTIVAQEIFEIAAVRTQFPMALDNLVEFVPAGESIHAVGGNIDNYNVMLERGAAALGLEAELQGLIQEAGRIWYEFDHPKRLEIDESAWEATDGDLSAKLHYASIRAFHAR